MRSAVGALRERPLLACATLMLFALACAGCAAGDDRFLRHAAGFWAGLWHGAIAVVTFFISLFNDKVHMYETRNTGIPYDGGFVLGVILVWGGIFRSGHGGHRRRRRRDWDEIGDHIEESIHKGVRDWASECNRSSEDWQEISRKIEEKIKRELREWADR